VICNENAVSMVKEITRDIDVDDETLAFNIIRTLILRSIHKYTLKMYQVTRIITTYRRRFNVWKKKAQGAC